jgi:hypothetical protein
MTWPHSPAPLVLSMTSTGTKSSVLFRVPEFQLPHPIQSHFLLPQSTPIRIPRSIHDYNSADPYNKPATSPRRGCCLYLLPNPLQPITLRDILPQLHPSHPPHHTYLLPRVQTTKSNRNCPQIFHPVVVGRVAHQKRNSPLRGYRPNEPDHQRYFGGRFITIARCALECDLTLF